MFKNIFSEWASRSNNVQNEDYDTKKDHDMNPTSHVKKEGDKFCVYNVKGEKVKSFDTKPEADAYAKKNHDALMKEEVNEKVKYAEYKFKNKNDAMAAKKMLDAVQLMNFDVNDDGASQGELSVDAGNKDMTKYHKEIMKKFRPKVKMQEAMDAVDKGALKGKHKDRKDKDIDNDGDVDSSDKYLHKRRKAISKSMKKGKDKEGDVEMNPKLDKGSKENSVEQKESTIRQKLLAVLENKQTKGATKPETMDDKLKGKGAKDMVNQPKEVDDTEAKGHDDASKAGKVTKPAKPRNGGDQVRSGDQKMVNKVVDALKGMK